MISLKRLGLTKKGKERVRWTGGGLFAASVGLLGASATFPETVPIVLLTVGWLGVATGAVSWSLGIALPKIGAPNFVRQLRPAREHEIPLVHSKLAEYAGTSVVPLDARTKMFRMCPDSFQVLEDLNSATMISKIVGISIIFPLAHAAALQMESGQLKGSQLTPNHLVKNSKRAAAYYISFMWADDRSERIALTAKAFRLLESWIGRRNVPIMTRPTTDEAMYSCRRRKFRSLDGSSHIEFNEICILRDLAGD
jgi:hypothetical protein